MLRLLTRLTVKSVQTAGRGPQRFHVPQQSQDDLGSLFTPAVRVFASGHVEGPEPDCLPFGRSLKQSLVASQILRCLQAFIWF